DARRRLVVMQSMVDMFSRFPGLHCWRGQISGSKPRCGGEMRRRRFLTGALSCACISSTARLAWCQRFAGKQIRLLVPLPGWWPTGIAGPPLALMLGEAWKATIIVGNRGGAGGSVGADAAAKSSPDGATLLMGTVGTHAINPSLYKKLAYDAVRDFTPIS